MHSTSLDNIFKTTLKKIKAYIVYMIKPFTNYRIYKKISKHLPSSIFLYKKIIYFNIKNYKLY